MVDEGAKAGALEPEESAHDPVGDRLRRHRWCERSWSPARAWTALSVKATRGECLDRFIETGYTRLPVYDQDLDHIVGLVYAKDFLAVLKERDLIILPGRAPARLFRAREQEGQRAAAGVPQGAHPHGSGGGRIRRHRRHRHAGGPDGGDHRRDPRRVRHRGAGRCAAADTDVWEVEAGASLHDFGAEIGVEFPEEGEASSVGGFVAEHLGRIPAKGRPPGLGAAQFEVLEASDRQVHRVLVRRRESAPPRA